LPSRNEVFVNIVTTSASTKIQAEPMKFPLPQKVSRKGGFKGKSILIAAPTATGKSKIGMDLLFHYLSSKPPGCINIYLVPYRALARELFTGILERRQSETADAVIRVATGDYSDPDLDLKATDILIATYEKCDSLLRDEPDFRPYVVIADPSSWGRDERS
jgi:helicase